MGIAFGSTNSFIFKLCTNSTIHGVKYIGQRNLHPIERIFWTITVSALLGYSIHLATRVYEKFNANPVIISLQPRATEIKRVPFPAITLCNSNILKKDQMEKLYDELVEEVEKYRKQEDLRKFSKPLLRAMSLAETLNHICYASTSVGRRFEINPYDIVDEINEFLNVSRNPYSEDSSFLPSDSEMPLDIWLSISAFALEASLSCDEIILKCIWEKEHVPCKKIFNRIPTSKGSCCAFNIVPSTVLMKHLPNGSTSRVTDHVSRKEYREWKEFGLNDKILDSDEVDDQNILRYQNTGGRVYGLSIEINPLLKTYGGCTANDGRGYKLLAHSPVSRPDISRYGVGIPPRSEVFVEVLPVVSTADGALMTINLDKRNCFFPTEKKAKLEHFRFYSAANCWDECVARVTYRNCSCVRYHMPRNSSQRFCSAKSLLCAKDVLRKLQAASRFGECSKCLPACTEIYYDLQVSHFPLRDDPQECGNKTSTDNSIVHIYFASNKIYAKERKRLYYASDLFADAGGLLSLTLGFSLASFVEIFYFCTFRLWFHWKDDRRKESKEGIKSGSPKATWKNQPKRIMISPNGKQVGLKRLQTRARPLTPIFHLLKGSDPSAQSKPQLFHYLS